MSTLTHGAHVPYARRATSTPALGPRAATRRATVTFAQPSSDSSTSKKSPDAKAPSPAPAKKPPSFFENTKRPIWEMDIEGEFARQDKRKADEEAAQQKEAAIQIVEKAMSVRQAEALVRNFGKGKSKATSTGTAAKPDADIQRLEQQLSEKLGAASSIQHKTNGKGKLVISYNSTDELEGILSHFKL